MTDNQKARAWDALKVAASKTMESASIFKPRLKSDCLMFLGLMAEVEARVLDVDGRANPAQREGS